MFSILPTVSCVRSTVEFSEIIRGDGREFQFPLSCSSLRKCGCGLDNASVCWRFANWRHEGRAKCLRIRNVITTPSVGLRPPGEVGHVPTPRTNEETGERECQRALEPETRVGRPERNAAPLFFGRPDGGRGGRQSHLSGVGHQRMQSLLVEQQSSTARGWPAMRAGYVAVNRSTCASMQTLPVGAGRPPPARSWPLIPSAMAAWRGPLLAMQLQITHTYAMQLSCMLI